jgi:hypothetical protein
MNGVDAGKFARGTIRRAVVHEDAGALHHAGRDDAPVACPLEANSVGHPHTPAPVAAGLHELTSARSLGHGSATQCSQVKKAASCFS